MRLLLVEDEHAIRSALARALRKWGYDVCAAASLEEARRVALEEPVDAVVSDLKLPDGSGLDNAIELGVPFILMSGYANFEDAVVALRHGCVDFLTKPVAMDTLRESLQRLTPAADAMSVWLPDHQLVRPGREQFEREAIAVCALEWESAAEARALFQAQLADLPDPGLRLAVAECLQASASGRVVVNRGADWWRLWSSVELAAQADRAALLEQRCDQVINRAGGVLLSGRCQTQVSEGRELLFPEELECGSEGLDLSAVQSLGTWSYEWFRAQHQVAVSGARPQVKRQLQLAKLPIMWYASQRLAARSPQGPGVSNDERRLLWGDDNG